MKVKAISNFNLEDGRQVKQGSIVEVGEDKVAHLVNVEAVRHLTDEEQQVLGEASVTTDEDSGDENTPDPLVGQQPAAPEQTLQGVVPQNPPVPVVEPPQQIPVVNDPIAGQVQQPPFNPSLPTQEQLQRDFDAANVNGNPDGRNS